VSTSTLPLLPATGSPLLAAARPDLAAHVRHNGPLPSRPDPLALLAVVADSGLTGRGGAGFPTGRKLAAVRSASGRPVVVANGAEGEPASAKDALLLTRAPHLVLDGLQLAAHAVGARRAYVYAKASTLGIVRAAVAERQSAGYDAVEMHVVEAADAFVAGEESAVVAALDGGPPRPRDTLQRVTERGIGRRPTLVQNVETLAHLGLIARHGADWYRRNGTPAEPGTFLATVSGAVSAPGVYEAAHGITLRELLTCAGGAGEPLQAVLIGGYHGTWLPLPAHADRALSRTALRPVGASLGAGVVVALPRRECGLAVAARIATYLAGQSARQCGPCLNGLPRMADLLTRLARAERQPALAGEVKRMAGLVEGRGACHHPDGTARFTVSTLRTFADEIQAHLTGTCTAERRAPGVRRTA
jgi:NADH:ubiquinone oxidoreductase subunit F (NADH-binding)